MPILLSDGREARIPQDIKDVRREFNIPAGECLGCYLGDCSPDMHDVPDACEYFGGLIYDLPTEEMI